MLDIQELVVCYDDVEAVSRFSLRVAADETVALLGPSGCGKSTLLRAIAGLEPVGAGAVYLDGVNLIDRAPHERGIGMMFQHHALFPHRDVAANIEFGLRMAGIDEASRRRRISELLELVDLAGYERRAIVTLSGGEAQRVALARSLAPNPRVLLLDEPFGSLDRSLRDRLVEELPPLLRHAGVAAIHVTHDHAEAFGVGDRVAVMAGGELAQTGTPEDVWSHPVSAHVARFLGHSNIIDDGDNTQLIRADAASVDPSGELDVVVVRVRFRDGAFVVRFRTRSGTELEFILGERVDVGSAIRLRLDPDRQISLT
ncbi:MAG: ATP-binding cassette domain-containing protein [Actinobacteria bacterium]|jgi:thiamine transport system ATP-binding protein|nr:ATP-binding cassette domain-containing protein [Actinomycetota bacterium]